MGEAHLRQSEIDRVNDSGVGALDPQIGYRKKGFREFLLDFRDTMKAACSI